MRYAIGIDLGGTNIAAGIVNERYELLEKASVPTHAERPWQEILADMASLARRLLRECGLEKKDCAGIGVGSPGICDSTSGEVVYSNNLHWEHVPMTAELTRLTGLPARLSNDANCAALGEVVAGAAKGCRDVILLTLGTGVGGGVIIDGRIYEGVQGAGAELGHSLLVMDGYPCTCGRNGCNESYASATALCRQARQAAKEHPESLLARVPIDAKAVYDAMRTGDETAKAVVQRYETYLGETIVDMVNIFRPEMVLLGGGVSGEGKSLTGPLNEFVRLHCFGGEKSYVSRVETAALGNRAGILGAAALCLQDGASTLPMRLAPAFKDYLWGGERLKKEYRKRTGMTPLAESWELSCHKDGSSVILNGPFAGKTLADYVAEHPGAVGADFSGGTFPVLIKLIDAARPLSVQVHPDDDYAQRVEGEPGKTEMWYIVDAAPGAFLYYGFQHNISRAEAERRIANGTLTEVLNAVPVRPGDVFFIEAGTVHAIGEGILIAEIQQNSNTTYRMYDYNRRGTDGRLRPLHVQKALDVAKLAPPAHAVGPAGAPVCLADCTVTPLADCPYFNVQLLDVSGCAQRHADGTSFHSLLCLSGQGAVLCGDEAVAFGKGDSLFLPAGTGDYQIAGSARLICTQSLRGHSLLKRQV